MQMDSGLDTGPVLMQEKIPILEDDTTGTLRDRLAELGDELLRGRVLLLRGLHRLLMAAVAEAHHLD